MIAQPELTGRFNQKFSQSWREILFAIVYGLLSGWYGDPTPAIAAAIFLPSCLFLAPAFGKLLKELQFSKQAWRWASFASIIWLTFPVLNFLASPAQALAFQNAETFFTENFPQAATGIPFIFAALRGLFILYIAVALIRVINAGRNDEDWQTIARTPMIVAIIVAAGDFLVDMVIL